MPAACIQPPPGYRHSAYPALPVPEPVPLVTCPAEPCPYLPGHRSQVRAFHAEDLLPDIYHDFMDAGFRRSGKIIYQPVCRGCRACTSLRIRVADFRPDKSQRRCRRRNADLTVSVAPPVPTEEKYDLYRRYVTQWHGSAMQSDRDAFVAFLYDSPVQTLEFAYRDPAGRLLAVGICDLCTRSLSSVYFYHDPQEARRGLGTFGILHEIEHARQWGIAYYYLGYTVSGCPSMHYKESFRPHELLYPDGIWREPSRVPACGACMRQ